MRRAAIAHSVLRALILILVGVLLHIVPAESESGGHDHHLGAMQLIATCDDDDDLCPEPDGQPIGDSRVLGQNLVNSGTARPAKTAAHHIVAGGSNNADAVSARQKLVNVGLGINEAANGVFLPCRAGSTAPGAWHPSLHTNTYFANVWARIQNATTKQQVIDLIAGIRQQLLNNTFPF